MTTRSLVTTSDEGENIFHGPVAAEELKSIAKRVDLKKLHGKSILVTGSSGLIGNYLAQTVYEVARLQGHQLRRLILQTRSGIKEHQLWAQNQPGIEFLNVELDFTETFPPCEVVIHAASPASPSQYGSALEVMAPNISGVLSSLAMRPSPERFLYISSGEVYAYTPEGSPVGPAEVRYRPSGERSTYPNAKLVSETLLFSSDAAQRGHFKAARLFHTFGAGYQQKDGRSFADFLTSAAQGEPIRLYSSGVNERNFCYIEDSVVGLLMVLLSDSEQKIYDVGGEERISIKRFAEIISKAAKVELAFDYKEARGSRKEIQGDPPVPQLTPLKELGWRAEISVAQGVDRTLHALRAGRGSPIRTSPIPSVKDI